MQNIQSIFKRLAAIYNVLINTDIFSFPFLVSYSFYTIHLFLGILTKILLAMVSEFGIEISFTVVLKSQFTLGLFYTSHFSRVEYNSSNR